MSTFPQNVITAAQAAHKSTGCPASITLAQWALESGYGQHLSAPNNYFGIKWHPKCRFPAHEIATKEFYNGKWTVVMAQFISFPTLEAACEYHGKLLMQPPYNSQPFTHDWKTFLHHVAHIYATDPEYEQKITSIITQNKLDQYD